jgi:formamidopyrimidine-DNA glycosylase
MDAKNVVGVGNVYASEALFSAGIRPRRAAGRLSRAECAALAGAVRNVLAAAIRAGGTTLRDYVGVDQGAGSFQRELCVYGRAGEACVRCGGAITRTVDGGRSTFFCRSCQT